jgi:hypothetical protein
MFLLESKANHTGSNSSLASIISLYLRNVSCVWEPNTLPLLQNEPGSTVYLSTQGKAPVERTTAGSAALNGSNLRKLCSL